MGAKGFPGRSYKPKKGRFKELQGHYRGLQEPLKDKGVLGVSMELRGFREPFKGF